MAGNCRNGKQSYFDHYCKNNLEELCMVTQLLFWIQLIAMMYATQLEIKS